MFKNFLTTLFVFGLGVGACLTHTERAFSADQQPRTSEDEVESSIRELVKDARYLRPLLDRAQFELGPLLEAQDFDADEIARFVRDEIALEIYAGTLRGALGTLVSGAGNALDQSLLLATLLKDAGFEARINRGQLAEQDVDELLNRMTAVRSAAPSIWSEPPTPKPGTKTDNKADAEIRAAWIDAAQTKADYIISALATNDVELDGRPVMAEIRNEARDYYWVEMRNGPTDPWRAVHPALGRNTDAEIIQTFADEIPAELTHRVRIEVLVELRRGANVVETPLLAPIELTSANLTGVPLKFAMVPDQLLNKDSPLNVETMIGGTRFLFPMVNGKLANGAKALSVRGLLVPPDSLALGAGGLFETVSDKGAQAIDAISGLANSENKTGTAVAIQALRLQVTFRSPNGDETVAIRELFDEQRDISTGIQDEDARQQELVVAMARTYTMHFATGKYQEGLILNSQLEQIESLDGLLNALAKHDDSDCQTLKCLVDIRWKPPEQNASSGTVYQLLDSFQSSRPQANIYRHVPNMLTLSQALLPRSGPTEQRMDIIANARRAVNHEDNSVQAIPAQLILSGTWETQVETDIVARPQATAPLPASFFAGLRPIDHATVQAQIANSGTARAMMRDLKAGYRLFAIDTFSFDTPPASDTRWWRVDPLTGETLGMNPFGGAVATETLAVIAYGLVAASVNAGSLAYCMHEAGGTLRQCASCANLLVIYVMVAHASVQALTSGALDRVGYFNRTLAEFRETCLQNTQ